MNSESEKKKDGTPESKESKGLLQNSSSGGE